jgi:8-oxo-dGTP pyrophosphatase MutT (NUDIX family)
MRTEASALESAFPGARYGAVLALFYPIDGEPYLVLTRRNPNLRVHAGQISMPGGRIDPLDFSPLEAALRETREEVGAATDRLEILGDLAPAFTRASNFILLGFAAWARERPAFVVNPAEVAELIEVPFDLLLRAETAEEESWDLRGVRRRIGLYRFGHHKIWGATARLIRQIVNLAGGEPPLPGVLLPGEVDPDV